MKIQLTKNHIESGLACPEAQTKIEYCDNQVQGFRVDVTAKSPGVGTYYSDRYNNYCYSV